MNYWIGLAVGAAATIFVSAAFAQSVLDAYPADAPVTFEQLSKVVLTDFRDPKSAQFKGVVLSTKSSGVICGWVNAKNGLGGYSDFYPFAYLPAGAKLKKPTSILVDDYTSGPTAVRKAEIAILDAVGCAKPLGLEARQKP